MRSIKCVIIAALCCSACVHNRQLDFGDTKPRNVITRRSETWPVKVLLTDGTSEMASNVNFSADSIAWQGVPPQASRNLALAQISTIQSVSYGRGALDGLGVGILAGVSFGVLIGILGEPGPDELFTRSEEAFVLGIVFGGAGGLIGFPVGALMGSTDIYHPATKQRVAFSVAPTVRDRSFGISFRVAPGK